ncbi:MAG: hypothetical protein RW306_10145, partial [Geobacteraceae bacterium]|nr:hypothetical protein [Geobacteraceae bacterium]
RLAWTCDRPELIENARKALAGITSELDRNPLGHLGALQALSDLDAAPVIATLSGTTTGSPVIRPLLRVLKTYPLPRLAIRLENSRCSQGVSICADQGCFPKAATPDELKEILRQIGGVFEPEKVLRAEK